MAKASLFLTFEDQNGLPILGESINAEHQDWIELSGWNWAIEDQAALPRKVDTTTDTDPKTKGKPKLEHEADARIKPSLLSFTKKTDRSTVSLIRAMDRGEIMRSATLVLKEEFNPSESASESPFHLQVSLRDVLVMKLSWSVDVGNAGVDWRENWDLNYGNIKFTYKVRKAQGGKIDMEFDRRWDDGGGAGKKSPLTEREKNETIEKLKADIQKSLEKKGGK
jgi:type VI protein secretion system component Hcp